MAPALAFRRDSKKTGPAPASVGRAISAVRFGYAGILSLSAIVNVFMLTGSLFMLQVYDRVLTSRSLPTLAVLLALVVVIYAFLGVIETLRTRAATRVAEVFEEEVAPAAVQLEIRQPLDGVGGIAAAETGHPVRDLDRVRQFIGSPAAVALSDLPWLPIYLVVAFMFHRDLGLLALGGVLLLVAVTAVNEWVIKKPVQASAIAGARRAALLEAGTRNAEAIAGLGMRGAFLDRFRTLSQMLTREGRRASDRAALFSGLTKSLRLFLQSASLALGAYLALQNEITAGMIIGVSIITSRALAPVEQAIGQWKGFVAARQSWYRLRDQLIATGAERKPTTLPRPNQSLAVADLAVSPPGADRLVLAGLNFQLRAGSAVGVIGPSGAGKSTLARTLVGIWKPLRGSIRLDGAELSQWSDDDLGRHLGYLPQDVELFDGTVAENIARLAEDADADGVIEAARHAGAHDMILRLPKGYDTPVGPNGLSLSAGQRQRIGLARALYGAPFLIVLDEPNANLDAEGDEALRGAIEEMRRAGSIVVVIAHRPSAVAACDQILVLGNGRQTAFGPRDAVLQENTTNLRPVRVAMS